jgi:Ferritin-like domain
MQETNMEHISLTDLDVDGAIEETAGEAGLSRSDLMRRGAVGGIGLLAGGSLMAGLPSLASGASFAKSDVAILNYALTLEYLESSFYDLAVAKGGLTGRTKEFAKLVKRHEATHVAALKSTLGKHAVAKPKFNFHSKYKGNKTFQATAFALENTGVGAYLGQAGKLKSKTLLGVAASIVTIEARHSALISEIIGGPIANATPSGSFDKALTKAQVLSKKRAGGFLA